VACACGAAEADGAAEVEGPAEVEGAAEVEGTAEAERPKMVDIMSPKMLMAALLS
jgi:hypothetical protein